MAAWARVLIVELNRGRNFARHSGPALNMRECGGQNFLPMILAPWCDSRCYVTLHGKRDFADDVKIATQLTLK